MRRRGLARTIGLIIVAMIAVAAIGYALLQPAVGWPSEDRRVVHPAGFSVVAPKDWERTILFAGSGRAAGDALQFLPKNAVGNPGAFTVTRLPGPPADDETRKNHFEPSTFAGRPALQAFKDLPKTLAHARGLIFERDGAWYEIGLTRPNGEPLDSGVWQAYLESFRPEHRRPAASMPAFVVPEAALSSAPPSTRPATQATP